MLFPLRWNEFPLLVPKQKNARLTPESRIQVAFHSRLTLPLNAVIAFVMPFYGKGEESKKMKPIILCLRSCELFCIFKQKRPPITL